MEGGSVTDETRAVGETARGTQGRNQLDQHYNQNGLWWLFRATWHRLTDRLAPARPEVARRPWGWKRQAG